MGRALKCDRCGAYYDPVFSTNSPKEDDECSKVVIFANTDGVGRFHYLQNTAFELCPECAAEFWAWIKGKEISNA